jgi:hypothetical protein
MTDKQKKTALIVGAVILVILLLLFFGKRAGMIFGNGGTVEGNTYGGVTTGGVNLTINRTPFTLPAFALPDDQFSMISGCCSDCSSRSATTQSYLPANSGLTLVFNAADQGPTINNYYTPAPPPAPTAPLTFYGYSSVGGR